MILKNIYVQDFLKKGVLEVYPFINKYINTELFMDFFTKYSLVTKELILKTLRNSSRQRRSINKYFDDFNILLGEANMVDNEILSSLG